MIALRRLKTDYIDFCINFIGLNAKQTASGRSIHPYNEEKEGVPLIETLEAMNDLVRAGKVRYIGVSNETPWGLMTYLRLAEKHDLPRVVRSKIHITC
ncbi:aldo/keto reductase [Vibrio sp. PP-XX7]